MNHLTPRTSRDRDERGQVTTALVMVVMVGLVVVGVLGVFGLSRGADEKSKAQSAADAASLAGAGALSDLLPEILGQVRSKGDLASLTGCSFGQDRAVQYADRNAATLTTYCFDLGRDEVSAQVRMDKAVTKDAGPAVADAVASTGLDISSCTWADDAPPPTPEPTPSPSPSPSDGPTAPPSPPPPLPDLGTALSCGSLSARFSIGGETGLLSLVSIDRSDLRPRIIS